jgi:putative FmdB family regulatory protein
MPMYEYECGVAEGGCGHHFEVIQTFSEKIKRKCPKCHKLKLKRLFGSPTLIFRGTGFYITDYKNKDVPPIKESKGD